MLFFAGVMMTTTRRFAFSRLPRWGAWMVLGLALAFPAAQAAPKKSEKKTAASSVQRDKGRKTAAARKAGPSRKVAQQPTAGRGKVARASAAGSRVRVAAASAAAPTRAAAVQAVPARMSFGQMAGLHLTNDPLDLKSSVALVIDQDTQEVLLKKNDQAVLPIASLTKLMTGLLVSEARLPLDEHITITQDDVDTEKGSRSRLQVGTTLTRGEMLHLALMSS